MEWLAKHDGKTISRGRVTKDRRRWTLWANSRESGCRTTLSLAVMRCYMRRGR